MSDESTKNQDSELDENPNAEDSEISDIDRILSEEDPEFFSQLEKIKIESAEVNFDANESISLEVAQTSIYLLILRRPFEFKTNTKIVVSFWLILFAAVTILFVIWKTQEKWFSNKLFLNSYEEVGTDLKEFNPNTELEPFYDNPRFAKNLITISPIHVNLKQSENSGPNPMLAIEITVEGLSADAIIEIKDREAEFKDLLARHTEDKTYDDLIEINGKQKLCEQYRDLINLNLSRGQVRRVLLKSFIIKS